MSQSSQKPTKPSILKRLLHHVFPVVPDFYTLLSEQCDLAVESTQNLVSFLENNDAQCAKKVLKLETKSDELRASHTLTLNESFATAIDRDDIYRGITSIDDILDYAKATVRLVHALDIQPDTAMVKMAKEIHAGSVSLQQGYAMLGQSIAQAKSEAEANATHRSERDTEKIYRKALVALFDEERLSKIGQISEDRSWAEISQMFKKRELYRHLSNAADHVSTAGEYLHNTIVKAI